MPWSRWARRQCASPFDRCHGPPHDCAAAAAVTTDASIVSKEVWPSVSQTPTSCLTHLHPRSLSSRRVARLTYLSPPLFILPHRSRSRRGIDAYSRPADNAKQPACVQATDITSFELRTCTYHIENRGELISTYHDGIATRDTTREARAPAQTSMTTAGKT